MKFRTYFVVAHAEGRGLFVHPLKAFEHRGGHVIRIMGETKHVRGAPIFRGFRQAQRAVEKAQVLSL